MLYVYAATGDRLLRFETSAAIGEDGTDDCAEVVKCWLTGAIGAEPDEDGGAIFCLAVTGKPGDRYDVTRDGTPVAVVVRA